MGRAGRVTDLLQLIIQDHSLPGILSAGLVIAFVASPGYLVATMAPRDPDDDGARFEPRLLRSTEQTNPASVPSTASPAAQPHAKGGVRLSSARHPSHAPSRTSRDRAVRPRGSAAHAPAATG
jgi:hypothetical protein